MPTIREMAKGDTLEQDHINDVVNRPIARGLLFGNTPARLAYTSTDGSPRVIPTGFYRDGERFTVFTTPNAPRVKSLTANPTGALTIDTNTFPPHVLLIRGTASLEVVDGLPDDYQKASRNYAGEEGKDAFEEQVRGLYKQMARITIVLTWVESLDFKETLPSSVEELMSEPQNSVG